MAHLKKKKQTNWNSNLLIAASKHQEEAKSTQIHVIQSVWRFTS